MVESLDVLDLVEGEVERCEFGEGFEALDVCDEVVVKVDLCEGRGGVVGYGNAFYTVLAETETLCVVSKPAYTGLQGVVYYLHLLEPV